MTGTKAFSVRTENIELYSEYLDRLVKIDFYLPPGFDSQTDFSLLIINDGQDLQAMGFDLLLAELQDQIRPLICAGIHCSADRKMEYGIAEIPDFKGRGAKAKLYTDFILNEFLPFSKEFFQTKSFSERSYAGFSLGGLSALDIVWNNPTLFSKAGVFSGSLWWRSIDQHDKEYDDNKHRIMHQLIRNGAFKPNLDFFFQCGNMDETKDRNNNGIIDSIDDTQDLIKELKAKGYSDEHILYYEMKDGRHDVATWARAFPAFLKWGWSLKRS
jgi:enterochelin esterase-like enzyme